VQQLHRPATTANGKETENEKQAKARLTAAMGAEVAGRWQAKLRCMALLFIFEPLQLPQTLEHDLPGSKKHVRVQPWTR
jgi:hypothetical protein